MWVYLENYSTYEHWVCANITFACTTADIRKFITPVYSRGRCWSGQILACFLIKLPNRSTYLLVTRYLRLMTLDESINVAIFAVQYTKVRVLVFFSALERSIWKNSTLRSASPAQDDVNGWKSYSWRIQWSFTELCTLHTFGQADDLYGFWICHGNTARM